MAEKQEGAGGGNMMDMMAMMMPVMMDSCLSILDTEQQQGMLTMCREMLDQMEVKYPAA